MTPQHSYKQKKNITIKQTSLKLKEKYPHMFFKVSFIKQTTRKQEKKARLASLTWFCNTPQTFSS